MATVDWRGDSPAVAKVYDITLAGTILATETLTVTINGKNVVYTIASGVLQDAVDGLVALLQASTIPEFKEVTWTSGTNKVVATATTAGMEFTTSSSDTSAGGTFTSAVVTTNAGPNDVADISNYSTGALPSASDTLVIEGVVGSLLYNVDALAALDLTIVVKKSFTGDVGLPETNGTGTNAYSEYRPRYLQIDGGAADIGEGAGTGSGRILIDGQSSNPTVVTVYSTGSRKVSSVPAFLFIGADAANTFTAYSGDSGIAVDAAESATINTVDAAAGSTVQIGASVTVASIVKSGGGTLTTASSPTSSLELNNNGTVTITAGGTIPTVRVSTSTLNYGSSGTITSLTMSGGRMSRNGSLSALTITAATLSGGATVDDPNGTISVTSPGWVVNDSASKVNSKYPRRELISFP